MRVRLVLTTLIGGGVIEAEGVTVNVCIYIYMKEHRCILLKMVGKPPKTVHRLASRSA